MSAALPLPDGSGPVERALAAGMADTLDVPVAASLDPYAAPAEFLPFLAVHHGVRLWFSDWPEARKREIVAHAAGLSRSHPGERLNDLVGTRRGVERFLFYVDATVIDRVAHPTPFRFSRAVLGRAVVSHPPFKASYLVHVLLDRPAGCLQVGRGAIGRRALRTVDRTPIRRAITALQASKGPATQYLATFAWRRRLTFADAIDTFQEPVLIGGWTDRKRL